MLLQVLNKGKIIQAARLSVKDQEFTNIPLLVTTEMLPSFRLVGYYMLPWQNRAEVVSDSVFVDVEDRCVGSVSPFNHTNSFSSFCKKLGNFILNILINILRAIFDVIILSSFWMPWKTVSPPAQCGSDEQRCFTRQQLSVKSYRWPWSKGQPGRRGQCNFSAEQKPADAE